MKPDSVSHAAVKFFHESIAAEQRGDFNGSYQLLLASLGEDTNIPGSWFNLGVRLHEQKRWTSATAAFSKALSFAPDAVMPKASLGWNLHHAGRDDEALKIMLEVIDQEPNTPQHWVNISQISLTMGDREKALEYAERAVELDPNGPMPQLALALSQLRMGNYRDGLKSYESRFPFIPVLKEFLNYPYPMWRGQDLTGKTLFIAAEQGLGDSVQFLRFIPEAAKRARKTIVYVHDNAFKLFRRNLAKEIEVYPLPKELPAADYFCPMLSLPVAMNLTNEEIINSYWQYKTSFSPVELKTDWRKIGICWAGDPAHDNDRNRSSSLEYFLPLAELPNVQLYSIQVGPRMADLDTFGAHALVKNMSGYLKTVADTAAFIRHELDCVVTVDTAVAHIAASVGVKTCMLLGKKSVDWRWGTGEGQSVWYPSLTMYLQKEPGNWAELIERVKTSL